MIQITALVLATALSYPLGLAIGQAWLLPLLNALPAYLLMARLLLRGQRRGAVVAMLAWAASMAIFGTLTLTLWPSDPGSRVLHGVAYREEMFTWIRTGVGSEGDIRLFLPQHLLHLAVFVAASLATASAASILMGAVLTDYMAYYVASLARAGVPAATVVLLGWQPWALCRVAAFCILGVVLAEPLLTRITRRPWPGLAAARPFLLVAASGILADWVLKAALAPLWRSGLQAALP